MEVLKEVIRSVRNIRAEVNTPLSKPITLLIKTNDTEVEEFLTANTSYLERFCNPEELVISREIEAPELAMSAVLTGAELFLPLAGLINIEEEIARLEKIRQMDKEVKRVQGKLSNERFVSNAPDEVVEAERAKKRTTLKTRGCQRTDCPITFNLKEKTTKPTLVLLSLLYCQIIETNTTLNSCK